MIAWWWMLVAFFSGAFLGAMVMALCVAGKRGDEMAELANEERMAMERTESIS
jgi:hypothetical protein